jgi:hypothetical protein
MRESDANVDALACRLQAPVIADLHWNADHVAAPIGRDALVTLGLTG